MPGNYTVKLTANGKSSSQPLVVKMDPRISAPQEALQQEFRAASRLTERLEEVTDARKHAEELLKQIDARSKETSGSAEVSGTLGELARKLADLTGVKAEDEFGVFGLSLPGKEPPTLHKVASTLTGLLTIVDGADAAPTADARAAIEKWDAAAAETMTRWRAVAADVATVNAVLEKAKLRRLEE